MGRFSEVVSGREWALSWSPSTSTASTPSSTAHDLRNTGSELMRIIAFFSAPKVQQHWTTEVREPGALKITGTPNN
jgi:hypothetical protein